MDKERQLSTALAAFIEPMRRYTKHTAWLEGDENLLIEAYKQAQDVLQGNVETDKATDSIESYIRKTEFHGVQRYTLERAVRALISSDPPNRLEALALIRGVTGATLPVAKEILISAQNSR